MRNDQTDRTAARGIPGSPVAADGREHIRGFACPGLDPKDNWHGDWYLSADRRMWCPDVDWDQKKVRDLLEKAFPYGWGRNPSSGV
jgi:hypothetical protein